MIWRSLNFKPKFSFNNWIENPLAHLTDGSAVLTSQPYGKPKWFKAAKARTKRKNPAWLRQPTSHRANSQPLMAFITSSRTRGTDPGTVAARPDRWRSVVAVDDRGSKTVHGLLLFSNHFVVGSHCWCWLCLYVFGVPAKRRRNKTPFQTRVLSSFMLLNYCSVRSLVTSLRPRQRVTRVHASQRRQRIEEWRSIHSAEPRIY